MSKVGLLNFLCLKFGVFMLVLRMYVEIDKNMEVNGLSSRPVVKSFSPRKFEIIIVSHFG